MRSFDLRRFWSTAWPVLLIMIPGLLGTRSAGADERDWSRPPDLYAEALVVLAALSASVVRRRPAVTSACCTAAVATYLAVGYPVGPILIAVPVAAAAVAVGRPLRWTLVWNCCSFLTVCAAGSVRFGITPAADDGSRWLSWLATSFMLAALPTAIGIAVRIRQESQESLRAAHARQAVSQERLRMAHELHDSVGHGLAVIAMQAGVALHVLERKPGDAREPLEAIAATSRAALHEMRAQLDLLRGADGDRVSGGAAGDGAPLRPAPSLAEADVLLSRIRAGGLQITAEFKPGDLPPEIDLAAYRILQESLTNVLQHAGVTRARVRIVREGDQLVLEIVDDGPAAGAAVEPAADGRAGTGIAGMRARAAALGGELDAGHRTERGFAVRARLPLAGRTGPASVTGSQP